MKRLTLLRHAKSSWDDPGQPDFERPLNARGLHDAPRMGQRLRRAGARPSLILTSPAVRALETAKIVAAEIGYPREFLQREQSLYLADPETILETVSLQDNAFNDVMVVGHNPGLHELAERIGTLSLTNLPTCAVMVIDIPVRDWEALLPAPRGETVHYDWPRNPNGPDADLLRRRD